MELSKIAREALKKLCMEAASVDDIIAGAKEHGIELAMEQAKALFDNLQAHKEAGKTELTDEDLEKIAGGMREPRMALNAFF